MRFQLDVIVEKLRWPVQPILGTPKRAEIIADYFCVKVHSNQLVQSLWFHYNLRGVKLSLREVYWHFEG